MTSDAALVLSSCPDNTPTIGLHQFRGTKGLDLVGVFYVAAPPHVIESALAPYSYPGFCNTCYQTAIKQNRENQINLYAFMTLHNF